MAQRSFAKKIKNPRTFLPVGWLLPNGSPGGLTMTDYQKRSDITTAPLLLALAPPEGAAFLAFNNCTERQDGVIPIKYRALIALGVALTTQCAYCIDVHTRQARDHGVAKEELAEAAFIAAAVRAGGVLAHSLLALRLYEEDAKAG
jgi:AhpD family alkylhydroperoxidase